MHHIPRAWAWVDPATYNLASISTLARAVMIWKDQDGYGLGGWLRPRPRHALGWPRPGPSCLFPPRDPRGPCPGTSGGRGRSGSGGVKPVPAGSPVGSVERGLHCPRPGPAGLQECVLPGRGGGGRGGQGRKGRVILLLLEARKPEPRRTGNLPGHRAPEKEAGFAQLWVLAPQHPLGSGWWRWKPGPASPGARGERGAGTRPGCEAGCGWVCEQPVSQWHRHRSQVHADSGQGRSRARVGRGPVSPSQETPRGRPPQGHRPSPGPSGRVGRMAPCLL